MACWGEYSDQCEDAHDTWNDTLEIIIKRDGLKRIKYTQTMLKNIGDALLTSNRVSPGTFMILTVRGDLRFFSELPEKVFNHPEVARIAKDKIQYEIDHGKHSTKRLDALGKELEIAKLMIGAPRSASYKYISLHNKNHQKLSCIQLYEKHKNVFYQMIATEPGKKKCRNDQTDGGFKVTQIRDEDLVRTGDKCQRRDQRDFISYGRNTGKRVIPVSVMYDRHLCPVEKYIDMKMIQTRKLLLSSKPIRDIRTDLPELIRYHMIALNRFPGKEPYIVETNFRPSSIHSYHSYLIGIKKIRKGQMWIKRDDIVTITPFLQKSYPISAAITSFPKFVEKELKDFFNYRKTTFSDKVLNEFKKMAIHENRTIRCYRGLLIHSSKKLKELGLEKLQVGDRVKISSRGKPMSWSGDGCIASYFATHGAAMAIPRQDMYEVMYGIVFSCEIRPNNILIDSRLIDPSYFLDKLYTRFQDEVITRPRDDDDEPIEFNCTVERLFLVNNMHDTAIVKKLSPFFQKFYKQS